MKPLLVPESLKHHRHPLGQPLETFHLHEAPSCCGLVIRPSLFKHLIICFTGCSHLRNGDWRPYTLGASSRPSTNRSCVLAAKSRRLELGAPERQAVLLEAMPLPWLCKMLHTLVFIFALVKPVHSKYTNAFRLVNRFFIRRSSPLDLHLLAETGGSFTAVRCSAIVRFFACHERDPCSISGLHC